MWFYRPSESLQQEIINAPPPLATVMNDKAKMDTEVSRQHFFHLIISVPLLFVDTVRFGYNVNITAIKNRSSSFCPAPSNSEKSSRLKKNGKY